MNYTLEADVPYTVADTAHPIMQGMTDFTIKDEAFFNMTWSKTPEIHVLATAVMAKTPSAGTHAGEVVPQIWTYEKSLLPGAPAFRAFVWMQGHNYANFADAHVQPMLLRGIAWAGKRPRTRWRPNARSAAAAAVAPTRRLAPRAVAAAAGSKRVHFLLNFGSGGVNSAMSDRLSLVAAAHASACRSSLFSLALTGALWLWGSAAAPATVMTPRDLLRTVAQFTDADWGMVEHGLAVAKVLDTDTREVAISGAVRIHGTRDTLVTRSRDLAVLKASAAVLDAGKFSPVPTPADLQPVTFEEYSLDVRNCRPGDCHVRLGADDISRFQRSELEWRRLARAVRQGLAGRPGALRGGLSFEWPQGASRLRQQARGAERRLGSLAAHQRLRLPAVLLPGAGGLPARLRAESAAGDAAHALLDPGGLGIRPIFRISHQVILQVSGAAPST